MSLISKVVLVLFSLGLMNCAHGGKHSAKHGGASCMADADKDGVITKAEFDTAHSEKFKKLDVNGDGKITQDESKAGAHSCKKTEGAEKKSCCK